jgi:hypothetical protein
MKSLDFEIITSEYRDCGTLSDVTNLLRDSMGVKLDIVQRRSSVKSTFRHTLDT